MIITDDTPSMECTIGKVRTRETGWDVDLQNGWSIFIRNDQCTVSPEPGELAQLYGRGIGYSVRGVVIGGRVYSYEDEETHERKQEQIRQQLREQQEAEAAAFRAAPKAPLYPFATKPGMEADWTKCVEINSQDEYSYACLRFAAKWAELMEKALADKTPFSYNMAERMAREADTEGFTGFMFSAARSMLEHFWARGDDLKKVREEYCEKNL